MASQALVLCKDSQFSMDVKVVAPLGAESICIHQVLVSLIVDLLRTHQQREVFGVQVHGEANMAIHQLQTVYLKEIQAGTKHLVCITIWMGASP